MSNNPPTFDNVFGALSLLKAEEFCNHQLVPPSCNLQEESNPSFLTGKAEGREYERRVYTRRYPQSSRGRQGTKVQTQHE